MSPSKNLRCFILNSSISQVQVSRCTHKRCKRVMPVHFTKFDLLQLLAEVYFRLFTYLILAYFFRILTRQFGIHFALQPISRLLVRYFVKDVNLIVKLQRCIAASKLLSMVCSAMAALTGHAKSIIAVTLTDCMNPNIFAEHPFTNFIPHHY
nr:hypothetical protein HmN_000150500 [Hymenolepis microstoma]